MARSRIGIRRAARGRKSISFPFVITNLNPGSVTAGAGATPIDVQGAGFPAPAIVYVDNVAQATTYAGAALLQFTMGAPVVAIPGFKTVQVKSGPLSSNATTFAVNFPIPTLASLSITVVFLGEGPASPVATGSGFYNPGTTATIDGAPMPFSYASLTSATLTVAPAVANVAGVKLVAVSNPLPGGGASASLPLSVRYRAPTLASLSSAAIPVNSGTVDITLTVTNAYNPAAWPASGGTVGRVDGVDAPTVYLSATSVRITLSAAITAVPGPKAITVFNPTVGGGGGASGALTLQVLAGTLTSIDSVSRVQGFDAFLLTATGTNFFAGDAIRWGTTVLPTTFVSATTLTATVPAALLAIAGTVAVNVHTPSGYDTNSTPFVVTPWSFLDIGATLRLWVDGTSLVDDGSGRASAWNDLTPYGHHLTQPSSANRPLITAGVALLNGQTAPFFSGSRPDFFSGIPWIVLGADGLIQKLAYNIWVVGSAAIVSQVAANACLVGCDNGLYISAAKLDTSVVQASDSSGAATNVISNFNWNPGAAFAFRQRKAGGSLFARTNRGAETSAVHGVTPASFAPDNILLGRLTATLGEYTGFIGIVLVTDSDLNYTHKSQIDNLLSSRFGTTFGTLGAVANPVSVTPNTAMQFDVPFTITVAGSGTPAFVSGDFVNMDGFVLATTFVNATTLTATVSTPALATSGRKNVTVSNAAGISGPVRFDIAAFNPGTGPNLTSVSPTSATRFDDPFTLVCGGSNFTGTSVVFAGAIALPTVLDSASQVHATVTAAVLSSPGTKIITVHDGPNTSQPQNLAIADWGILDIPTLSTWYRSDTLVTSGSAVTQWTDLSGNNYHLVQATGTKQPTLIASDPNFNGRPSVDFDGTDDTLVGTIAAAPNIITNAAWSAGAVYRFDVLSTNGIPPAGILANASIMGLSGSGYFGVVGASAPAMYALTSDAAFVRSWVANTGLAAAVTQQFFWRRSLALNVSELSINNSALASAATLAPNISSQFLSLGSNVGANYYNGQITEAWTARTRVADIIYTRWKNYSAFFYGTPA